MTTDLTPEERVLLVSAFLADDRVRFLSEADPQTREALVDRGLLRPPALLRRGDARVVVGWGLTEEGLRVARS